MADRLTALRLLSSPCLCPSSESGYLTARSGRTLIFSFYANDVPGDVSATEWMDRTLNLIAAEN